MSEAGLTIRPTSDLLTKSFRRSSCRSLELNAVAHLSVEVAKRLAAEVGFADGADGVESAAKNFRLADDEPVFVVLTFSLLRNEDPARQHVDLTIDARSGTIERLEQPTGGTKEIGFDRLLSAIRTASAGVEWNVYARFTFTSDGFGPVIPLPIPEPLPGTPFTEIEGVRLHAPAAPGNPIGRDFSVGIDASEDHLFATVMAETPVEFDGAAPLDKVFDLVVACSETAILKSESSKQ